MSKLVYGNLAGFEMNRSGAKVPVADDDLTRTGFCKFKNLQAGGTLDAIRTRYLDVLHDPEHTEFVARPGDGSAPGDTVYRYVLKDPLSRIPLLHDLVADQVTPFLEGHYRRPFRLHSASMWRTTHVPADIAERDPPYSLKWHNDHHTTDTVKLFILLSDVSEDDGPFHFLDKDRTRAVVHRGFRDRHHYGVGTEFLEDPRHLHKFVGKVGDSVFCNTTVCLHRAGIPAPGHTRDIMQFRFDAVGT